MPDENTPAPVKVELDADGKQLQLQAEKAKYLETIAKSQQAALQAQTPSITAQLPTVADAPKGEVTVGEKAGAIGAWRAHHLVDALAKEIAEEAGKKLGASARVLVVEDRALLEGDWTARQVLTTLTRLQGRVADLRSGAAVAKIKLISGIVRYRMDEKPQEETPEPAKRGDYRRTDEKTAGQAGPSTGAGAVSPSGLLGGAVDMLGLLRTDYTLTAGAVAAAPSELATLTAGKLVSANRVVEADRFATVPSSPSQTAYAALLDARNELVKSLWQLQAALSPVEAELAALSRRIGLVEQEWTVAVADAEGKKTPDVLRATADSLAGQSNRRDDVAAQVRTFLAEAVKNLAEIDAGTNALTLASPAGEAPLLTAARRERLASTVPNAVTHVLYVSLDSLAADTVTRRSILGASGVVRFLSAANASWLLLDTATGAVVSGKQERAADLITLNLTNGEVTAADSVGLPTTGFVKDPMVWVEWLARALVLALVAVLVVVGFVALIRTLL